MNAVHIEFPEDLGQLALFADLPAAELEAIAGSCEKVSFGEGEWIIRQGADLLSVQPASAPSPAATLLGSLPIAEHGVIGDLHTVALVGTDGTIDWYCCPHFDSPSVFAAILDRERGGYYRIAPAAEGWT